MTAEPREELTPGANLPVVRGVVALRQQVRDYRRGGARIGLVPTMGALHQGHLALVRQAGATCDRVIATLFVNPTQFDRADDLRRYPRDEARDRDLLAACGCDLLFAPPAEEIYPDGFATTVSVAGVSEPLEGTFRPGHFQGVATVVAKLLLQALPDVALFGEKDFQQLQVVRRMARDLDIPVAIEGVPTVREADGLAMSSRNANLSAAQRRIAPTLAKVLHEAAARLTGGEAEAAPALAGGVARLREAGFDRVDYLDLRDARTLEPLARADRPARLLAAAWLGETRLIDNVPVGPAA